MWSEYLKLVKDVDWLKNRQEYHPGLNIELSLKKSIEDFWSKDAGWENKKSAKIENINWKATFNNALTLKSNQVWKQKEKQEDKY